MKIYIVIMCRLNVSRYLMKMSTLDYFQSGSMMTFSGPQIIKNPTFCSIKDTVKTTEVPNSTHIPTFMIIS